MRGITTEPALKGAFCAPCPPFFSFHYTMESGAAQAKREKSPKPKTVGATISAALAGFRR